MIAAKVQRTKLHGGGLPCGTEILVMSLVIKMRNARSTKVQYCERVIRPSSENKNFDHCGLEPVSSGAAVLVLDGSSPSSRIIVSFNGGDRTDHSFLIVDSLLTVVLPNYSQRRPSPSHHSAGAFIAP